MRTQGVDRVGDLPLIKLAHLGDLSRQVQKVGIEGPHDVLGHASPGSARLTRIKAPSCHLWYSINMVTRYGMDETVGQRTYLPAPQPFLPGPAVDRINAAEATACEIDIAVRDIIARAFDRASEILRTQRANLDKGVELLLTKETLTADEFAAIRPRQSPPVEELAIPPASEKV